MAEGGQISCSSGSECTYNFFCELCVEVGKHLEAHGYCVNCKEYLCEECYHGHKRSRSTRHHVLMDTSTMPQDTPLPSDRVNSMISTMCKSHIEELVKFYCKSHAVFGCSTCFATVHKSCPDVENILDRSENIFESQEFKSFTLKLKSIRTKSEDMLKVSHDNKLLIRKRCSDAVFVMKQFKHEVVLILKEIENNFVELAHKLCSECEEQMDNLTKELNTLSEEVEAINSEIESLCSTKRVCQLYIKMKQVEQEVTSLQKSLKNAERENVINTFKFQPNLELTGFLKKPDILGKISYQNEDVRNTSPCSNDETRKKIATYVGDINVRSSDQIFTCDITGSAVLSNNRVIIIDFQNNKVKLVNSHSNTVISDLSVSSRPWDVTALSLTKVAVTFPDEHMILLLSVGEKLDIERKVILQGDCHGVAYIQGRLFVTYIDNPRLEIINLSGKVIKTVEHDSDGRKLFDSPKYVCVSNGDTCNTIYVHVTDRDRDTVTSITYDWGVETMSVYTDVALKGPRKVCTDHHGNVYVCSFENKTVHMILADCKKGKVILTGADRLYRGAYSISHCQYTNRLFVGMWRNNKVKVYQLS